MEFRVSGATSANVLAMAATSWGSVPFTVTSMIWVPLTLLAVIIPFSAPAETALSMDALTASKTG